MGNCNKCLAVSDVAPRDEASTSKRETLSSFPSPERHGHCRRYTMSMNDGGDVSLNPESHHVKSSSDATAAPLAAVSNSNSNNADGIISLDSVVLRIEQGSTYVWLQYSYLNKLLAARPLLTAAMLQQVRQSDYFHKVWLLLSQAASLVGTTQSSPAVTARTTKVAAKATAASSLPPKQSKALKTAAVVYDRDEREVHIQPLNSDGSGVTVMIEGKPDCTSPILCLNEELQYRHVVIRKLTHRACFLLGHMAAVEVSDCHDSTIVIGPTAGTICLTKCRRCLIVAVAAQMRLQACDEVLCSINVLGLPLLERSTRIGVCPLVGWYAYSDMARHMRLAGLSPVNNNYSTVRDVTPPPSLQQQQLQLQKTSSTLSVSSIFSSASLPAQLPKHRSSTPSHSPGGALLHLIPQAKLPKAMGGAASSSGGVTACGTMTENTGGSAALPLPASLTVAKNFFYVDLWFVEAVLWRAMVAQRSQQLQMSSTEPISATTPTVFVPVAGTTSAFSTQGHESDRKLGSAPAAVEVPKATHCVRGNQGSNPTTRTAIRRGRETLRSGRDRDIYSSGSRSSSADSALRPMMSLESENSSFLCTVASQESIQPQPITLTPWRIGQAGTSTPATPLMQRQHSLTMVANPLSSADSTATIVRRVLGAVPLLLLSALPSAASFLTSAVEQENDGEERQASAVLDAVPSSLSLSSPSPPHPAAAATIVQAMVAQLALFTNICAVPATYGAQILPPDVFAQRWKIKLMVFSNKNGGWELAHRILQSIETVRRRAFLDAMNSYHEAVQVTRGMQTSLSSPASPVGATPPPQQQQQQLDMLQFTEEFITHVPLTQRCGPVLLLNSVELRCSETVVRGSVAPVFYRLCEASRTMSPTSELEGAAAPQAAGWQGGSSPHPSIHESRNSSNTGSGVGGLREPDHPAAPPSHPPPPSEHSEVFGRALQRMTGQACVLLLALVPPSKPPTTPPNLSSLDREAWRRRAAEALEIFSPQKTTDGSEPSHRESQRSTDVNGSRHATIASSQSNGGPSLEERIWRRCVLLNVTVPLRFVSMLQRSLFFQPQLKGIDVEDQQQRS